MPIVLQLAFISLVDEDTALGGASWCSDSPERSSFMLTLWLLLVQITMFNPKSSVSSCTRWDCMVLKADQKSKNNNLACFLPLSAYLWSFWFDMQIVEGQVDVQSCLEVFFSFSNDGLFGPAFLAMRSISIIKLISTVDRHRARRIIKQFCNSVQN